MAESSLYKTSQLKHYSWQEYQVVQLLREGHNPNNINDYNVTDDNGVRTVLDKAKDVYKGTEEAIDAVKECLDPGSCL
jgi:hypothetical protein